jgi:outer membrane protein OmpA-like peptidoglycan-associated protein
MKTFSCFFLCFSLSIFAQEYEILQHEKPIKIVPLPQLNTSSRECNLSLLPNGNSLYFMSTRAMRGGVSGNGDIYQSDFVNGTWQAPIPLETINTTSGEDEPTFSKDGSEMYFQSWAGDWQTKGGPYYRAEKNKGSWVKKGSMGDNINRFFSAQFSANFSFGTDGMAVSADGKLFIVACGADYDGPMDMYYSVKTAQGWSYPQIMGISTEGDERSVFIAADNRTIYFSSDGMGGFGGLDIFKVQIDKNGKLGEPVNIGAPFNTAEDDMGFVASADGKSAFFIRNLDIYYADISELSEKIKPIDTKENKQVVPKEPVAETTPTLPSNTKITLYFDSDESVLLPQEKNKLEGSSTDKKYVVHGYCDSDGTEAYNLILAEQRCKAVISALTKMGIADTKITMSIHGEASPASNNNTESGKAKNRRVEVEIE